MSCTIRTWKQHGSTSAIQVFNLFGESGDLPDVVHCETIASRSVLHDWELAAHRHARLHQVLLIDSGGGQATLDGRIHALRPMHIVNVPVGHVHGFSFEPGTQGWVLTDCRGSAGRGAARRGRAARGCWRNPPWCAARPQMRTTMKQIFAEFAGAAVSPERTSCAPCRRR